MEIEQTAEPAMAADAMRPVNDGRCCDQAVVEPLVMPFNVIVRHELCHCSPEVPLPHRDHTIETLRLDRSDESLHFRAISVRCQRNSVSGVAMPRKAV